MKSKTPSYVAKWWFAKGWGDFVLEVAKNNPVIPCPSGSFYDPPKDDIVAYYLEITGVRVDEEYDAGRKAAEKDHYG